MSNRFLEGFIPLAGVVFSLAGALVLSASAVPTAPLANPLENPLTPLTTVVAKIPETSYIGTDRCITCHRNQTGHWSETKHAEAFSILPEQYREDETCLKCHVTGFGEPGGFASGMTTEEARPFQSVGCEACHGPGAAHEESVRLWTLSEPANEEELLKGIKTSILRLPLDGQCATCHKTQSHQGEHPPYEGQPVLPTRTSHPVTDTSMTAAISLPPSPHSYSVKTCGSCHYVQYKQWRVDIHADLSLGLPTKYETDESCLNCHRKTGSASDWYTAESSPASHGNPLGIGCESCHGPALKHVLYNKQFISGRKLDSEIVEAARESIRGQKPVSACLQCHVRDGHKSHPEYEKPAADTTK